MTSGGNNFNYFPRNQLTKFSAVNFVPPTSLFLSPEDFCDAFCVAGGAFGCPWFLFSHKVSHTLHHTSSIDMWTVVTTGYFSFRGRHGTVFITALCAMLRQYHTTQDLIHILTRVNHDVAYFFESLVSTANPDHRFLSHKKQMPTIVSMLTKDIYFVPKQLTQTKQQSSTW